MSDRVDPRDLARHLRQREEMGLGGVFLDRLGREDALRALRGARPAPPSPTPRVGGPAPGAGAATAGARGASTTVPSTPAPPSAEYVSLRDEALVCRLCGLCESRTQVVFSDGNPAARLMVVGEAPGANEDATGLPFVGQAGKLLDLMLASVGLSRRDSVYICNVLKCRPPGNRNPNPDEIASCAPFLRRQIELVRPEAILAVGGFAAQWLTGTQQALGKLRGEVYSYEGAPLVVTYHPAALLRNPGWSRATWDDLQLLRRVMDGR